MVSASMPSYMSVWYIVTLLFIFSTRARGGRLFSLKKPILSSGAVAGDTRRRTGKGSSAPPRAFSLCFTCFGMWTGNRLRLGRSSLAQHNRQRDYREQRQKLTLPVLKRL